MKPFAVWLGLCVAVFGGLGGAYHAWLSAEPRKVLVAVDSSYPMQNVWHRVPGVLKRLSDKRYTEFALISEKSRIHGWQDELDLGRLKAYGPRSFDKLADPDAFAEIDEAAEIYLLTNAPPADVESLSGWTILRPGGRS